MSRSLFLWSSTSDMFSPPLLYLYTSLGCSRSSVSYSDDHLPLPSSLSSSSPAQQRSRQSDQTAANHDPEHIGFEPIERGKSGDARNDREPVRSARQALRPDY